MHLRLANSDGVERTRRSVAMLHPRAWALTREEAGEVLDVLGAALRQLEAVDDAVSRHPAGEPRRRRQWTIGESPLTGTMGRPETGGDRR